MDRSMRALGLHGKPSSMIIGTGCNVPGVMSPEPWRTKGQDDCHTYKSLYVLWCQTSHIYGVYSGLFPETRGLVLFSLYAIGIIVALTMGKFSQSIRGGILLYYGITPL